MLKPAGRVAHALPVAVSTINISSIAAEHWYLPIGFDDDSVAPIASMARTPMTRPPNALLRSIFVFIALVVVCFGLRRKWKKRRGILASIIAGDCEKLEKLPTAKGLREILTGVRVGLCFGQAAPLITRVGRASRAMRLRQWFLRGCGIGTT